MLTTLVCTSQDSLEQDYFLHASELILRIIGRAPTIDEVVSATSHLATVFQRLSRPAKQTVTGIIGELVIIRCAASPEDAVAAWRSDSTDRYDFVRGYLRLEVKATQRRERAHQVSYDQCHPPTGAIGVLASVIVESAGGGMSIAELLESIEGKLGGSMPAMLRLHEVMADTLGASLPGALGERFDQQLAETSLLLFNLSAIPSIRGDLPQGISDLRFLSHLSGCSPISIEELGLSETDRSILPRRSGGM